MRASSVIDCFPRMCQTLALIHSNERMRKRVRDRQSGGEGGWVERGKRRGEGGKEERKNLDGNRKIC